MRRGVLLLLALAVAIGAGLMAWRFLAVPLPPPAADLGVPVAVPSGAAVYYVETISNEPGAEGLTYRFRFVAPGISREGGSVSEDTAHADMEWLCNDFAQKRLPETGPAPAQIIIAFSDRPGAFGEPNPDATTFFEGYRIENGACVWELF